MARARPRIESHHAEWLSLVETSGPFLTVPTLRRVLPDGLDSAPEALSNEIEVDGWDFGGHGDDHPECPVCIALKESSPHTTDRVKEIGSPHIGCRQNWHPRVSDDRLPESITIGQGDPAG